jgi:hypothetical protein
LKKSFLSLLLLLIFSSEIFAQIPDNKLAWSEEPLKWENFEAEADLVKPYDANTNSGISYSWSLKVKGDSSDFQFEVESWFYPEQSWVKKNKKSEYLLAHEQLHFDISELVARKLRRALEDVEVVGEPELKEALEQLYQKNADVWTALQKEYDVETRHGQDSYAQKKWKEKITAELILLENYKL